MFIFDPDLQEKLRALGNAALGQQTQPFDLPPSEWPSNFKQYADDILPPPPLPDIAPPSSVRNRYIAMRTDLIAHGGEKLESILTEKKYQGIRERFELGDAAENAQQISALDPISRNELAHATLRSVTVLDETIKNNPQFEKKPLFLEAFLTPRGDVARQVKTAVGVDARPFNPTSTDPYEQAVGQLVDGYSAKLEITEPPEVYVYDTGVDFSKPVTKFPTAILKDGTPILVVDLGTFRINPNLAPEMLADALKEGHYADNEQISAFLAQHKDLPLTTFLTDPEFAPIRDKIKLNGIPGTNEDITPAYISTLDAPSVDLLNKQKARDAIQTVSVSDDKNPYSNYNFFSTNNDILYQLLSPSDHENIVNFRNGAGPFDPNSTKPQPQFLKTATRVDPALLKGEEKEFYEHYTDMMTNKHKMGLDAPPEMYVLNFDSGYGAYTTLLKDGTAVTVMDESTAKLSPKEKLPLLAHEGGHLVESQKLGLHNSYDQLNFFAHDSLNTQIKRESKADKIAWGPRGVCSGDEFISGLRHSYNPSTPMQTILDSDLNDLAMGIKTHPSLLDREHAAEHAHPSNCVPYYKSNPKPEQNR